MKNVNYFRDSAMRHAVQIVARNPHLLNQLVNLADEIGKYIANTDEEEAEYQKRGYGLAEPDDESPNLPAPEETE